MRVVSSGYNYTHPKDFYIDRPNGSPEFVLIAVRSSAYFVINGERLTTITGYSKIIIYVWRNEKIEIIKKICTTI